MIYFWADTHFNHPGIVRYCFRPFQNVWEMNAALVERWNSKVGDRDDVFFLGDFGFSHSAQPPIEGIFSLLKGKKHLIIGNHDEKNPKVLKLPWQTQSQIKVVKKDGVGIVACHYPFETWSGAHKGRLHVHGHSHGTLKRTIPHRWDVGVDVEPFPISFEEIVSRGVSQQFEATDHHGDL